MAKHRLFVIGAAILLAAGMQRLGADPPAKTEKPMPVVATARDAQALAAKIDEYIALKWNVAKAQPAPLADDAEFCRRVHLDLAGRIPLVSETRAFLDDKAADKRQKLVEKLLASPAYVNHFTNVWRALLLPEADTNFYVKYLQPMFENWIRQQVAENVPYDKMVRTLLTTPVQSNQRNFFFFGQNGNATPLPFYMAKDFKPENLGAATARLFLGVRLECAQCHDHPFASWKREQFWGHAAFFAGLERPGTGDDAIFQPAREILDRRELAMTNTDRVVQAGFLDGHEPQWKYKSSSRVTLADWVTSPDNTYFARTAANRLWSHFFGVGIVDPVDDFNDQNIPSHPELLDELSRQFVAHKFDFKFMIRAITSSRTYQLTSTRTHASQDDSRLFASMALRGMSGEQLFDSLATAVGYVDPNADNNRRFFNFDFNTPRAQFLQKFAKQDKATETHTSILQALSLMNGSFVRDATTIEKSETLAAVADSPFMDTPKRIETLYLATLGRKPQPHELSRLIRYVDGGGAKKNPKNALADVFWVLINSGEFMLNH